MSNKNAEAVLQYGDADLTKKNPRGAITYEGISVNFKKYKKKRRSKQS
jgi:hypothetical protein